jgi:hypothetical protein
MPQRKRKNKRSRLPRPSRECLRVEELEARILLDWTPIGPSPQTWNGKAVTGRVSALAIEPVAGGNSQLLLGAAGGGIWRSINIDTNNPINRSPQSDYIGLQSTAGGLGAGLIDTGSIAFDPNNPQTIYVGTGEANYSADSRYGSGLLVSRDWGDTYQVLSTGTAARPTAFFGHAISKVIVDPHDSNHLYLAVTRAGVDQGSLQDKGIYTSTDGE